MTHREVRVVPHDPAWTERFEDEAAVLRSVLGDEVIAVHHIGSTSVPNLSAKPTIVVLVEVQKVEKIDDFDGVMIEEGYEAWGEYGIPGRRFFTKNRGPTRTHNVHVFETGTPEVESRLAFRDYLIQHPKTASAYGTLEGPGQKVPDRHRSIHGRQRHYKSGPLLESPAERDDLKC